jgi:hypothetical protein
MAWTTAGVSDEVKELEEWRNTKRLAPRGKQVMPKVLIIVLAPVVLAQENLDAAPRGLDGVCVGPGVRIDEMDAVVDGAVRKTVGVEIALSTPAVTDDHTAGFDPGMYNGCQCVSGSVRNRNKKCSAGPSFNTAKHPLALYRGSGCLVVTPTELAAINFDGPVRTTDLFRSAPHEPLSVTVCEMKQCSF